MWVDIWCPEGRQAQISDSETEDEYIHYAVKQAEWVVRPKHGVADIIHRERELTEKEDELKA